MNRQVLALVLVLSLVGGIMLTPDDVHRDPDDDPWDIPGDVNDP